MKCAASRRIQWRGDIALQDDPIATIATIWLWDSRQECLRVRVLWSRKYLGRRPSLDDPPQIHHGDAVAEVFDYAEIMRDKEIGESKFALQFGQQVEHLRLNRYVKRGNRLVENNERRIKDQRAGNPDTLTLPAREFMRIATSTLWAKSDHVKHLGNLCLTLGRSPDSVNVKTFGDRLANRRPRIKAGEWILKDDLRAAAIRLELRAGELGDVTTIEENAPSGRFNQPQDKAADGCLAAARLANEAESLAGANLKVNAVNSANLAHFSL